MRTERGTVPGTSGTPVLTLVRHTRDVFGPGTRLLFIEEDGITRGNPALWIVDWPAPETIQYQPPFVDPELKTRSKTQRRRSDGKA